MAFIATAIRVMLASPGDVRQERDIAKDVVYRWNDIHSVNKGVVLLPVGWETHTSPELAGRPQAIINERVLKHCDLLVGIFWTRLGTPTGEAESGTVEEIGRHVAEGKPAMLYFSSKPIMPSNIDIEQFEALKTFRKA